MRLSLKARLTLTFIMLLGLMAAMGGFSLYLLQAMQTRSQTIVQENFSAIRTFDELAERSQSAAIEISEISAGSVLATKDAGNKLNALVELIERTSALVSDMSRANSEIALGAEQMRKTIIELDDSTQANDSASVEMSSTAEMLAAQAAALRVTISNFTIAEKTSDAPVAAETPEPELVEEPA